MKDTDELEPPNVITSDTDNATKLQPKEADPKDQAKFRRLRAYNRGTWNGPERENKEVVYRQDNLHRYDSIASSLSLTDHQKNRGRSILDNFDLRKWGQSVDLAIFGICVLVANHDVVDGKRYYPGVNATDDPDFEKVGESLGFDLRRQRSTVERVRKNITI